MYAKGNGALGPNVFEPFVPEAALLAADIAKVGWFIMALFFFFKQYVSSL